MTTTTNQTGTKSATIKRLVEALEGMTTETAGKLTEARVYDDNFVLLTPSRRERLDHYGGGHGWDEDGWSINYARPLRDEVEAVIGRNETTNVVIDDKGFVGIYVK